MGEWIYRGAILVLAAIVTEISAQTCPEVCFCEKTTVQCESLSEDRELQRSVRDMPPGTETLILNDYRSRGIQARTFFTLTELRTLRIESGRLLVSLERHTFLGLSQLENLTISGTALQTLPDGLFEPLAKLNSLYLINTPVRTLGNSNFIGLTELQHLHIINNGRLETISRQAFDPLVSLSTLSLQGSIEATLVSGVFSKLSKLVHLDLSKMKKISPIDRGIFEGLVKLKTLFLKECNLKYLERHLLQPMGASLEILDVSRNVIATIKGNTFADCEKLRQLDLSHNLRNSRDAKTVYEPKAFSGLVKLTHLDISSTDLGNLTTETWKKVLKPIKGVNISADGCSYHCSCSASDLGAWLRRNDVTILLSCTTPTWLTGTAVKTLTLDTLKCTKPAIGTRKERFQVLSPGDFNATATVVCGAYTYHGFPTLSYQVLEGEPFPKAYTTEVTESLFDEESRYNAFLIITVEGFTAKNVGRIRCKAINEYGYTEWLVDIPRPAALKKNTLSANVFKTLPIWVFGAVGVGAVLFILIFALVLAWRIRVRRRHREALRSANKNSDYYLECEKYEKYKIPQPT